MLCPNVTEYLSIKQKPFLFPVTRLQQQPNQCKCPPAKKKVIYSLASTTPMYLFE